MRVYKDTTFELSFMPWEIEPPKTTLVVVVKATYDLGDEGPCTIAEEPVPVLGEVPWDDGDPPSLRTESDYAILKPKAEWYLTGSAHVVGRPTAVLPIRVKVGDLEKTLTVWGDRQWSRGVVGNRLSDPIPFGSMPLRWERSFGGPKIAANPVGRGTAPIETDAGPVDALPNIEAPGAPILSRDDHPAPAGMFAIPCLWRERVRHMGTFDEIWKVSRWPFLPKDFAWDFFNCAPADQRRRDYWRGDEVIELSGLDRTRPRLRTRLPGLRARFFVERKRLGWTGDATAVLDRPTIEAEGPPKLDDVPLRLDTIVIDSDRAQVQCVWRGLVPVANADLTDLRRVFVVHEPIDANEGISHYEAWLLRKVLEEADELALEGPPEDEAAALAPVVDGPTPEQEAGRFQAAFVSLMETIGTHFAPEEPLPDRDAVREIYREHGIDPDLLLPPLDPEHTPELPDAPSLLRLAAIIRRKLGRPFTGLDLQEAPYQGLDLSGVDFTGSNLARARLRRANLSRAVLDGVFLVGADVYGVDFMEASLAGADLSEVDGTYARFARGRLDAMTATDAVFEQAIFHQASLEGTELIGCDLRRSDFRETKLDGADLSGSNVEEASFAASSMIDTSMEGVRGARAVFERCRMPDFRGSDGADFTDARFVLVDAPRAQLQGATLIGANFSGSNLLDADLAYSRAERINLMRCVLRSAKLDRADLTRAMMMQADLFEASLEGTILSSADLRGAHLFSAHLWRAHTDGTRLDGAIVERTVLDPKVLGLK